jgi:hypothetical protein
MTSNFMCRAPRSHGGIFVVLLDEKAAGLTSSEASGLRLVVGFRGHGTFVGYPIMPSGEPKVRRVRDVGCFLTHGVIAPRRRDDARCLQPRLKL